MMSSGSCSDPHRPEQHLDDLHRRQCVATAALLKLTAHALALIGAGRLPDCCRGRGPHAFRPSAAERRWPWSRPFQIEWSTDRVCPLGITINWGGFPVEALPPDQ